MALKILIVDDEEPARQGLTAQSAVQNHAVKPLQSFKARAINGAPDAQQNLGQDP